MFVVLSFYFCMWFSYSICIFLRLHCHKYLRRFIVSAVLRLISIIPVFCSIWHYFRYFWIAMLFKFLFDLAICFAIEHNLSCYAIRNARLALTIIILVSLMSFSPISLVCSRICFWVIHMNARWFDICQSTTQLKHS